MPRTGFADADQPVREQPEPDHAQCLAERIERRVLRMPALRNAPCAEQHGHDADRHVDEEDVLPSAMLDEQAAHQRPEDQRERTERGPPADRAGTLARIGKRMREDRHRARYQQRTGELDRAPDQQRLDAARACAHHRPRREQDDAGEPNTLVPVAIAERPGRQHERGQRQRIRVDDPLEAADIGIERRLQRRQRDVDDADVERGERCRDRRGRVRRDGSEAWWSALDGHRDENDSHHIYRLTVGQWIALAVSRTLA